MIEQYENSIPIIGFAGSKQSGKSTSAQALRSFDYRTYSFADPIRKVCRALGITKKYYGKDKDAPIPHLGKKSARYIMQTLGTDWARDMVSQTIWLDMMEKRLADAYKNKFLIAVDDVRFNNEATLIRDRGGIIIRIIRGDTQSDNHISERGVSDDLVSHEIENTGSVTDLSDKLEKIIYDKSLLSK
ncbi:MAG: deoxynucleotide monophosphate kinase [Bacteroidota bacterium]|nr:deoxynucleotide monophosphate kinase [Bacteroidota bacterium]